MKVVHLCTLDSGGAAASALRLHQGLSHFGIGSSVLVLKSKGQDQAVRTVPMRRARKDADSWQVLITRWQSMLRRYPQRPSDMELFSGPRADVDLLSHPEIRDADIINLHWVAGLVDIPSLPILARDRPVVWTLHDMNPLTGGCHFSGGCRRFEHGCGACPQLGSTDEADISAAYCAEKTSAYAAADFTVVSPSRWLAEQARSSSCMSGKPVLTIPYGLDHTIFAPQPALPIRRLLQLEAEDFIILYGADYACVRKGGDAAFRLLSSLPQTMHGRRVVLATFGAPQPGLAKTGLKHLDLGYLNSPQLMAQVYAMADVLLMPTLEDNLPNTVLESMGCGTPVVGFATGGMPDMVEHGNNGWLAEPQDIDGLRKGIENVLIAGSQTREAARQTILRKFTLSHQARAYLRVYANLLATTRALQSAIDVQTGQPIPESAHAHSWLDGMPGIEIGPAAHNPFGLDTINAGLYHPGYDKEQLQRTGSIAPLHIESPADCLPLPSETENFILHSHVLEHCPDLIRAMLEWYRVLKPQGLLYMIVPKRDAAPSDRGKPLSTWKHFLQDFTNRQTHEKEPNAGAFGYCHYHVFSNRTLQGVVRQIFGDRMELCDMLETDDKAGNGFTLVYRKVKALQESFPWVIGDHGSRHHLRLQNCDGREVIDVEQPRQQEPAIRMPAASRNPAMAGSQNDVIATVAIPIVDACRQAQFALKEPLLLGVAAFPATNPDSLSRQQACLSCLAALRHTGLHTVIPCLKQEQEALNDLFPEITTEPLLRNSADVRLQVPGAPKPFIDEYFDAACMLAEREGYEWFGFANSDVLFTPLLIAHLKRCMHQNLQSVVVSRTELPGLDADGRPSAGYLEFAGYDAFFCRVDWWREHRHLFAPYIIGERAWDDAYASIMLTNARCELLWEQGALWHPEHERRWDLENTVYGNWNMNLYSGRDRDYARRFEAFLEDLIAAGTKPLPEGEDRTRLLKRNFTEAAVVQGDPKRFVNIVMVTYNRLSFTRQAIGSILRTADWPYRITVVDNRSEDGTQDYLRELQRKKLISTLILNEDNKGVAVAANQGWIAEPEAQYTLKYDNDIVMQRNDWLGNMVKTAEAISQTGTLAYNFEPKSYSLEVINGHRVRPKHNGLNLGGACLLVPKRAEKILGFWSEEYGLYGEEDADYGYRSYLAGLLNLYMEDEDAGIHLPGGKAASIDLETYDALDESERRLHHEYRIFKDNLRRENMKKGGLFYRNKKLYDNGIKQIYINPLEIDLSKKINVAVYPLDKSIDACAHYRVLSPLGHLADHIEISWNENFSPEKIHSFKESAQNADIILIQRFFPCSETGEFINFLFSLGKPVVYEIDDLLTDLPMDNPSFGWSRTRKKFILDVARRASAVTVSTAALKKYFSEYNDAVFLLPNYIDSDIWANQIPGKKRAAPLRIGYAGTVTHKYDLKIIANALALISEKYGSSVSFLFFGCHIEELRRIPNSTFIDHDKSYHNYSKVIARLNLDILLIPLADSEFNNAKSNIKWLEYASLGVPGIYSNVKPYSEYITSPSFGLLTDNTTEDWFKCICRLIEDDGLRETISFSARSEVLASHDISRHAHKWLTTYRSIIKRHALKKPAPLQQNVPVAPPADLITVVSFHISGTRNSSQFLRQIAPLQELEKTGHVHIIDGQKLLRRKGSSYSLDITTLPQDTIVFLQRDFSAYEFLFETGLPLIYDLDDNLLELPAEHPDLQQYQRLSELLKTYLHRFAAVMVPTENLRRLCAPYNPNTRVIPNFIPLVPARATEGGRKIRILLSGTRSHLKDSTFLVPVIEDLCSLYPDTVEFIFWGYCPDSLRNRQQIHVRDAFLEDYPSYLQELASLQADIGLIPLNFTWFNSFKSDIKWKEYAVCGMVSIASDTVPYQSIRHGEDGYLADNAPQIWRDLLISLIEDAGLRQRVSETARNRMHAEFLLPHNLQMLYEALRSLPTRVTRTEQPEVSIIIPVFNKKELTLNCLGTLLNIPSRHTYEVIVVDNASTDGTDELLRNHFSTCRTLTNPDNMGFASACNQGATAARGEYLVFLNNDTVPLHGWLDNLVEAQLRHQKAGIIGCKLLYPDKTIQHCGASMNHDGSSFRHQYKFLPADHPLVNAERELDAVTAACCITPRTLFYELGMFDTGYSNGCEDMDYCSRVRQAGYRIYYTPDSVLFHLESQTQRPKNRDQENFERYLSKWGSGFMKNEIEIYAEDGFWAKDSTDYHHSKNAWLCEFSSSLKQAISTKDASNIFRYKNIIDRIYPAQKWPPLKESYKKINPIDHRLNILSVCHNFPPYNTAGAQLFAIEMARQFIRDSHDITFLYPVDISHRKKGDNKNPYDLVTGKYEEFKVFQVNVVDIDTSFMTNPQYMFANEKVEERFAELLEREKFHLVHFHLLYRLSARLPLVAKSMGIPTVATLHDYWLLCAMGHLIDSLGRECSGPESPEKCARCLLGFKGEPAKVLIDFFALRQTSTLAGYNAIDRIFSPSRHLAEVHARFGYSKSEILPLGWPEVDTSTAPRNQSDKIVFGFIGQIVYRKGLDLLVHAFLALDPEFQRRCELHIHGSVNQQHYFDALMDKVRDNPGVKFFGPYKHEDLGKILSTFDVTVIPSRQENYPLTLLESLSAKVPVIASDVGGIREMFQDKVEGFLFKKEDASRLTMILRMLITEPPLLGAMRDKIRPIKSISRNAEEYAHIYRALIHQ
jgi:glycosyltransferase involved in cell wall biosynthesis/GT2 family glycosyltransferase